MEDTPMTTEDVAAEFGDEVALLVDGVTKLGQLSYSADKVDEQAEDVYKRQVRGKDLQRARKSMWH